MTAGRRPAMSATNGIQGAQRSLEAATEVSSLTAVVKPRGSMPEALDQGTRLMGLIDEELQRTQLLCAFGSTTPLCLTPREVHRHGDHPDVAGRGTTSSQAEVRQLILGVAVSRERREGAGDSPAKDGVAVTSFAVGEAENARGIPRPGTAPGEPVYGRLFLLFACADGRPAGGLGDLVGTFDTEEEAREVFQRVRLSVDDRIGWAELVALTSTGRINPVCWFGRLPARERIERKVSARSAGQPKVLIGQQGTPEPRRRKWHRRWPRRASTP